MTEKQYRKQWLRWHGQYEKIAYRLFMKAFRNSANKIPFDLLNESNYEVFIRTNVKEEDFIELYYNLYKEIGLIHGKRVGKQVNRQLKEFTVDAFLNAIERDLLTWLYENSLSRITSVQQTYVSYLQELIAKGRAENKTVREIAKEIQESVNRRNFYRYQALRIARTETTAAANYASTIVSQTSGVVQQKVWISASDVRTRRLPENEFSHVAMNGVRVEENEMFKVPSKIGYEELRFAGDPKGSGANVINCRCSNVLVAKRDVNGRFIRR